MELCEQIKDITGSGFGGKGGSSHQPVEADDTLSSKQTVKILLAIHDGEIDSIENVYLNKVPYTNFDATLDWRPGTTNQTAIPGFINTEAPLGTFTPSEITTVTQAGPYSIDSTADAVRVTLYVQSLREVLSNGDLVGTSVALAIFTSPNNVTWTQVASPTKSGKASSKFAWDTQIARPANYTPGNNWYVKVARVTADSTSAKLENKTFIGSIIQIYYKNLTYPGTALVALTLRNAEQFGGQIPEVSIKGKFCKVKIPNNYDPINRTYAGHWNLGFNPVLQFTQNIAWVIFHCLNSNKCLDIPEYDIDKPSFYNLSLYADELISDGYGGQIPRYTIGYQFVQRENVPSFLANLLSLCNATLANNEFGQISIIFDKPNVLPSKIITNANVIDGLFNYTSNDLESRTTQVNVTFSDFSKFGETNTATVPDDSPTAFEQGLIDRYGIQPADVVLPGCKYEAQAIRKARWALYTNCVTTRFISFKVFLQGLTFYYGEVIKVMDSENRSVMQHGVITAYNFAAGTSTITLDRDYTLSNDVWTISFLLDDGVTLVDKTITETNTITNTISFAGEVAPYIGTVIILNGPIQAKLYTVTGIQKEDHFYVIAGVERDENKYTYIEEGIVLTPPTGDFVNVSSFSCEPIANLTVTPVSANTGTLANIQLHVHWDWDLDSSAEFEANFLATWRRDNGDYTTITDIQGYSFDINKAVPGTYEVNVWAINPATGVKSSVVTTTYAYKTVASTSSLLPPVNARITGTAGLTYESKTMSLNFDYNPLNDDVLEDSLLDYVAELWNTGGTVKYQTVIVPADINKNGLFVLPLEDNIAAFGSATRQYLIKLFSRDLTGEVSTALVVTVNNTVPIAPTVALTNGVGAAYFNLSSAAADTAGFLIHRSTTAGFTPNSGNIVYDGPDTIPVVPGASGTVYYYKIAAYDNFSKTGLNYSGEYSGTLANAETDKYAYTGLQFTPNSPTTNKVAWGAAQVSINGGALQNIAAGNATWVSGTLYLYFDKVTSTIGSTTDITIAVTKAQILATYAGGTNLKGGDGSAFFNGSQVLAQSIGANQLVADSAIITNTLQVQNALLTNAHISGTAAIANAKIANDLQSSSYNAGTKQGWKIDKTGNITSYGTIAIETAGTGAARMTIAGNVIKVFDSTGTVRVQVGDLTA